jgi:hypothetical protein
MEAGRRPVTAFFSSSQASKSAWAVYERYTVFGCAAMSAMGQSRRLRPVSGMSVIAPVATGQATSVGVDEVPEADMVVFSRSRLKTSSGASLTLHFLVALFDKTFAFAVLAFHFRFACILLHVFSKSRGLLVVTRRM